MNTHTTQTGLLTIVSGPAGSGKTTVCERMLAEEPTIQRVVTATTRKPRPGEINQTDYHFFDRDTFEAKIEAGEFYEYAHVHGNLYGTLRREVQGKLTAGIDLLLNIDVQGAASFRETAQNDSLLQGHVTSVFIMPPSFEELERRLRGRETDPDEEIQRRLRVAHDEMKQSALYDHTIRSASRNQDFQNLQALYHAEKAKRQTP